MQLHNSELIQKNKKKKRVGRGGKRGTYSGHGSKGQKARAGTRIRPGFRGGDNPIWKLFPKQRGARKKVDIKHAFFQPRSVKPALVNLGVLNDNFKDGDVVTRKILVKRGIINTAKRGVKVLADGELKKKLIFSDLKFSKSAIDKINAAGGTIK